MIICMNTPMVGTIEIMFALQMYKIQIYIYFSFLKGHRNTISEACL